MTTAAAEKKLPIVNGKLAVVLVSLVSGTIGAGSAITIQWKMFPPVPTIPDNILSLATDPYARPGAFTSTDGMELRKRIDGIAASMNDLIKQGPEEVKAQMTRMRADIMDQLERIEEEVKDIRRQREYRRYRGEVEQSP